MRKKKQKNLHCCEKCQNYWTCEEKWYRGENGEENVCCPLCNYYELHWGGAPSSLKTSHQKTNV